MKGNDNVKIQKETRETIKKFINYLLKQEASFDIHYDNLRNQIDVAVKNDNLEFEKLKEILSNINCSTASVTRNDDTFYVFYLGRRRHD